MRLPIVTLLACVLFGATALADSKTGTYLFDADATLAAIDDLSPEEKAALGPLQMIKPFVRMMRYTVTLKSDETFAVEVEVMSKHEAAAGTYKVDGETVTFTTLTENGKKKPQPEEVTATIKDGVLKLKDKEMPFPLILKKV